MKAIVYEQAGKGALCEVPDPRCGDDDIIIKVVACGICKGAELGHSRTGTAFSRYPTIPGHEFAGYVHEIGKNVRGFKVGDRVTADNAVPCGDCYYCRKNRPLLCRNFGYLGHNIPGGFAEYVLVDYRKALLLPENVSFEQGAIVETVACCVNCVDKLSPALGEDIAVLGAGPSGIILAQLIHHSSALSVTAIASTQAKLDLLEERGIRTLFLDRADHEKHVHELWRRFPEGLDAFVDTTASPQLVSESLSLLKKGGRAVQYGVFGKDSRMDLDARLFFTRQLSYTASGAQTHCFGRAIDYISSGKVDVDCLITAEYPMERYFEALERVATDRQVLKILIRP
ncbi:MAG: alcohol dehydrogenase catalytic domain-containing protein [Clostridiales bacterium]|nr:alcohol dehydrogenase catalytic domain-containing protein [Clostridiales bacterium]